MSAWSVCYNLKRLGYLKHAWNDALTFKRASRSLAKTGSFWGLFWCLFLMCFLGCFFGAQRVPKGSPKGSKIDEKEVSKRYLKKGPKKASKIMIFRTPQCGASIVNNSKIDVFLFSCWDPFWYHFGVVLGAQMDAKNMKKWCRNVIQKPV